MAVTDNVPLLEFDPDPVGVVDPAVSLASVRDTIPERVVMCFYAEILAALPEEAERVGELEAAHGIHPIWRVRRHGHDVAVFHPGVGAPLAAGFLEEAIVMGARKVVACGGCGTLTSDVRPGDIVVPTSAVRDEGTSFHYLPPSREVEADPHRPVPGGPAHGGVAVAQQLPRSAAERVFGLSAEQVVRTAEDSVEDPGSAVGGADSTQDCLRGRGPVDDAVGLLRRPLEPPLDLRARVVEELGPLLTAGQSLHRLDEGGDGRVCHLMAIQRALGDVTHWEAPMRPDIARVELGGGLQHGDAPMPPAPQDGPVQRGRAAVAPDPGMDDEARPRSPQVLRDGALEVWRHNEIRLERLGSRSHLLAVAHNAGAYIVAQVVELDEDALGEAVEGAGQEQDSHEASLMSLAGGSDWAYKAGSARRGGVGAHVPRRRPRFAGGSADQLGAECLRGTAALMP